MVLSDLNRELLKFRYTGTHENNYCDTSYSVSYNTSYDTSYAFMEDISSSNSQEITVPVSFLKDNSSLQAIVCYLRNIRSMPFNRIGQILNRDQRTIWVSYSKSNTKLSKISEPEDLTTENNYVIPITIFRPRILSVLESIVIYMKNNYLLSFADISLLLGKNYRTIYTVYKRGLKKLS